MSKAATVTSKLLRTLKELPEAVYTTFKYPVLLTIFALNVSVALPLLILGLYMHGPIIAPLFFLVESPIIFMIIKEALRQIRMLPMSETWETSPEKWNKAFQDYRSMLDKTDRDNKRP